jgi:hypothetical protein
MGEQKDMPVRKPTAAFVLSLLAGLWMLATAGMSYGFAWHHVGGRMPGRWMWCNGVMGDFLPTIWWPWFGILSGVLVLVGAGVFYAKPEQSRNWGVLILAVSAINLLVGVGGFLASVLGIVGGAMALGWHRETRSEASGVDRGCGQAASTTGQIGDSL